MVECEGIGLKWCKYYMKIEEDSPFCRELDALLVIVLHSDGDDWTLGTFVDGYDAIANSSQLVCLHSS